MKYSSNTICYKNLKCCTKTPCMTTQTLSPMGNSLGHPLLDVRVDVQRLQWADVTLSRRSIGSLSKRRFWQHGRHEVKKENYDWLKTWSLFPVNVRVVKNVVFLSSLFVKCKHQMVPVKRKAIYLSTKSFNINRQVSVVKQGVSIRSFRYFE